MNLALALQHVLACPVPSGLRGDPRFQRELRHHMRLAALRWQLAVEYGQPELARDCLLNAIRWRDLAKDV